MPRNGVFTILGSGFGMYGYLPALIEWGVKVALPVRYLPIIAARPELVQYLAEVNWFDSAEDALAHSNGAVIALRPADQARWVPLLAGMPAIRELILEKPIAPTPHLSASLLAALERAGKRYRVGYTFRFVHWAEQLRSALSSDADGVSLDWTFLAHHYRADLDNWKRFDASGGGALRFYGIHLIALLAEYGVEDVSTSTLSGPSDAETSDWNAVLTGKAVCPVTLRVNTRSDEAHFKIVGRRVGADEVRIVEQPDPFSGKRTSSLNERDPRVDVLGRLLLSFDEPDSVHLERQRAIIQLWTQVEERSRRQSSVRSRS